MRNVGFRGEFWFRRVTSKSTFLSLTLFNGGERLSKRLCKVLIEGRLRASVSDLEMKRFSLTNERRAPCDDLVVTAAVATELLCCCQVREMRTDFFYRSFFLILATL